MEVLRFIFGVFGLLILNVVPVSSYTASTAGTLYTGLTNGYNLNNRPSSSVSVSVGLSVSTVRNVDVTLQTFAVTGVFTVVWTDSRFVWDPTSFGSISQMYLKTTQCWHPELILDNAVTSTQFFDSDDLMFVIESSGQITAYVTGVFVTQCDIQTEDYPFDSQTCSLVVRSMSYDSSIVTMSHNFTGVKQENYIENRDWTFSSSSLTSSNVTMNSVSYEALTFSIKVSRQTSNFVLVTLIPIIMMSLLGTMTFLIPAACDVKLGFCAVRLLAEVILLTNIYGDIPSVSGTSSRLGIFLTLLLVLTLLETLCVILIVRVFHNKRKDKPVSKTTTSISRVLAKITCWRKETQESADPGASSPESPETPVPRVPLKRKLSIVTPDSSISRRTGDFANGMIENSAWKYSEKERRKLSMLFEWEDIADMLDRLCLMFFLFIRLLIIVIVMCVLSAAGN